ncbi:MAG: tryptophan 7-halogenase, partial [Bacteroidota bacterium]
LPSTYGFADPMHSTGIAWSLHGVEWIARHFEQGLPGSNTLKRYEENLSRELDALDRLVSVAYHSRRDPHRFELSTMLYFMATVVAEQHRVQNPAQLQGFLQTDNHRLWKRIQKSITELMDIPGNKRSMGQRKEWFKLLNNRFREWNNVGLFDSSANGVYRHTAPDFIE